MSDLEAAFAPVRRAAAGLEGVAAGTWYGTPALLARGKGFARLKDAETLVVRCPIEVKELLIEQDPEVYFETDHYRGHPLVLIRLAAIAEPDLAHRLRVGLAQVPDRSTSRSRPRTRRRSP
jgi:hypothetical protein